MCVLKGMSLPRQTEKGNREEGSRKDWNKGAHNLPVAPLPSRAAHHPVPKKRLAHPHRGSLASRTRTSPSASAVSSDRKDRDRVKTPCFETEFCVAQADPGLLILLLSHTHFMMFWAWNTGLQAC